MKMKEISAENVELRVEVETRKRIKSFIKRLVVVSANEISYLLHVRSLHDHREVAHASHGLQEAGCKVCSFWH